VKPERIAHRDQKSYFAVLLDDDNRKPIARLWFNGKKQKHLGLFDDDEVEVETKHAIESWTASTSTRRRSAAPSPAPSPEVETASRRRP
jgi:hypothetical protein